MKEAIDCTVRRRKQASDFKKAVLQEVKTLRDRVSSQMPPAQQMQHLDQPLQLSHQQQLQSLPQQQLPVQTISNMDGKRTNLNWDYLWCNISHVSTSFRGS